MEKLNAEMTTGLAGDCVQEYRWRRFSEFLISTLLAQ
jgi:hypothetical protein